MIGAILLPENPEKHEKKIFLVITIFSEDLKMIYKDNSEQNADGR